MDEEFTYNFEQITKNIDEAKVMSLFFPSLRKAIVIDTRSNESDGPMVRLMPMVSSHRERLRSIRRLRPGFPRLSNIALIPWPGYVDSLVETGVWERILKRLRVASGVDLGLAFDSILSELKASEKQELATAVIGKNYHTIWSSEG